MIGSSVRVYLAMGPVDLRGAFDRLCHARGAARRPEVWGAVFVRKS